MKRDPESLDALVAGALRRFGPITAYALAAALREQGDGITEVQAYRVLKRLIARGQARHVWLGRRYVACEPGVEPAMALVCRACGRTRFAPAPQDHAMLRARAVEMGFKADEIIIEAGGLCARCPVE